MGWWYMLIKKMSILVLNGCFIFLQITFWKINQIICFNIENWLMADTDFYKVEPMSLPYLGTL